MRGEKDLQSRSLSGRLKFLLKDSVLYGGAMALSKMLAIFVVPILTRIFSTQEYGSIDGIAVCAAVFGPFIMMGQDSAIARYFYEADDETARRQVVSQAFVLETILALTVCTILWLQAEALMGWFLGIPAYADLFRVAVLTIPFWVLIQFTQNLLKWTFQKTQFLTVSLGSTVAVVFFTLLYVLVFEAGIKGVFYAQLTGLGLFSVLGLFFSRSYMAWPEGYRYILPLLKFGWPYMLIGVCGSLLPSMDRYFISNYLSLQTLGLYAIGYKVASLIQLPLSGFQIAWGPFAYALYKDKDTVCKTYDTALFSWTLIATISACMLIAMGPLLTYIFASERYLAGHVVILPLTFSFMLGSLSGVTGIGLDLSKKTHWAALSYALSVIFGALAIGLFIGRFGLLGVAYGAFVGQLTLATAKTFFAYRSSPIRFDLFRPAGLFFIAFVLAYTLEYLSFLSWSYQTGIYGLLFLSLLAIIWKGFMRKDERQGVVKCIETFWKRSSSKN
ncbi:MAG: oligosaccharide flippase family protein [Kiritimatiellae bacterium]|nr:oligosaccharide flippase family protein [Kiritimatiellia bacterium]